jgi:hypothetical protein
MVMKKTRSTTAEQSDHIAKVFSNPRAVVEAMRKGVQDAIGSDRRLKRTAPRLTATKRAAVASRAAAKRA